MTADFAALPVEVQRIVAELTTGPSSLLDFRQSAISAAFAHGVIQASPWVGQGHTMYSLRKQSAVAA